jgi:hypothetical protein
MAKVCEVDPIRCPQGSGTMKLIAFNTDYQAIDHIIDHLKLTFVTAKPLPARMASQELLMAAEAGGEYFS